MFTKLERYFLKSIRAKKADELTEQEQQMKEKICNKYKRRFLRALETKKIEYAENEYFMQCLDPFIPYWFVSNEGKVWSVVYGEPKKLKPYKVSDAKGIDRWKLKTPDGDMFLSRIVANQWCSKELLEFAPDEPIEVHHEEPWAENPDRAEVLKWLPTSIHKNVTYAQRHGTVEDIMEQAKKDYEYCVEHNLPIFNDLSDIFTGTVDCVAMFPDEKGGCKVAKMRLTVKKPEAQQDEQTQEPDGQQN